MQKSKRGLVASGLAALLCGAAIGPATAGGPLAWSALPTDADLEAAFPPEALKDQLSGTVVLSCKAQPDGALADCKAELEVPAGKGFGAAALSLVPKIRLQLPDGKVPSQKLRIPIRFQAKTPLRPLRTPVFQAAKGQFSGLAPAGPYWPDSALRAGRGGVVALDCRVEEEIHLKDCAVATEDPPGFDFGIATLTMAKRGWMTAGPAPTDAPPPADGVWRFQVVFPPKRLQ